MREQGHGFWQEQAVGYSDLPEVYGAVLRDGQEAEAQEVTMANKLYNAEDLMPKGGGRSPKPMDGKPASMAMREKSGFPGADLPGKSGPDRSAGVHKCKVHPMSKGL